MEIKIFDSLVHSGINLEWPSKQNLNINIFNILELIEKEKIVKGALIQTSPWFDSTNSIELFYKAIVLNKGSKLVLPVATIPSIKTSEIKKFIDKSIEIGFSIFKIHPRFSNHNLYQLEEILDYLVPKAKLVQVCTYQNKELESPFYPPHKFKLLELLAYKSNLYSKHIMLMHSFDVSIMEAHSIVRHNQYLILDLSMTILKFSGSSIDNDIQYLFQNFDKRICIGSDYPEWNYRQLEKKLILLSKDIPEYKLKNIYYNNLQTILY